MTTRDPNAGAVEAVEARLATAYASEIPADLLGRLDRRVSAAIEARQPWNPAKPRLALPRLAISHWPLLAVIPVLLAILVQMVPATGGGQSLYDQHGGFSWQQAEQLRLTTTVDGYQVTLERAYADTNRLVLAITVVDTRLENRWALRNVSVADSSGVTWEAETAVLGATDDGRAESLLWFHSRPGPAPAGRRAFTVTGEIASYRGEKPMPSTFIPVPFSFSFDLTVAGGSLADLEVSSALKGVTITFDRITTSPTMVVINFHISGDSTPGSTGWLPNAFVTHNGKDVAVESEEIAMDPRSDGAFPGRIETVGVDDPSGDWTVTIPEMIGSQARPGSSRADQEVRIQGPWILHFSLP